MWKGTTPGTIASCGDTSAQASGCAAAGDTLSCKSRRLSRVDADFGPVRDAWVADRPLRKQFVLGMLPQMTGKTDGISNAGKSSTLLSMLQKRPGGSSFACFSLPNARSERCQRQNAAALDGRSGHFCTIDQTRPPVRNVSGKRILPANGARKCAIRSSIV